MLKSLLQHSKSHRKTLQRYVVAADFKKMLARMNHPVSTHYLACLQRVKSRTFEPIGEVPKSFDKNDLLFLDDLPILAKLPNMKIPNLERMAQAAEKENLYNKDTCMEFHELLCELLGRFHQSLKVLQDTERSKVRKGNEGTGFNQSDLVQTKAQVEKVLALGRALRAMVRGSAIKLHLTTIASFLEVNAGKSWLRDLDSEGDAECDAEFNFLKPYSTDVYGEPLLPWKSFHDWLRLMVHHLDAIHVLEKHLLNLNSPYDISIKVLYPSLPNEKMLPWQELLEDEKYFPQIPLTPEQPSAAELITFLSSPTLDEEGNTVEDIIGDVALVKENQTSEITTGIVDANFSSNIETLTHSVSDLKESSSTGWKDYVTDILSQVEALGSDTTIALRLSRLEGILNMLRNLKGSFLLYKRLREDSPLYLGTGFKGAVHCEIIAAVSNSLSGGEPLDGLSQDLLDEFKVSYISVPCSNLCQLYNTEHRRNARSF